MGTDRTEKSGVDMSDWKKIATWIITVSFPAILGILGFFYGQIMAHDTAIKLNENNIRHTVKTVDELKNSIDKLIEELRRKNP